MVRCESWRSLDRSSLTQASRTADCARAVCCDDGDHLLVASPPVFVAPTDGAELLSQHQF